MSADPRVGAVVEPARDPAYFPMLSNSPAISAGIAAHCPSMDQLGNARPQPVGTRCDSGAVEYLAAPLTSQQQLVIEETPLISSELKIIEGTETPAGTATATATASPEEDYAPKNVKSQVQ